MPTPICRSFFSVNEKDIPKEYRNTFKGLAQKAGDQRKVDSCDLDIYYAGVGATANEQITNPDKFIEEGFWPWSDNIFNYQAFHNHLTKTFKNHYFPQIKTVQPEESKVASKKEAEVSAMYKESPAGLQKVIDGFTPPYALVTENCITMPPFGDKYCKLVGLDPQYWYISGSAFLNDTTSGYGAIPLDTVEGPITDGWITYEYPFDDDNPFNWVKIRSYDQLGNREWYLNVDRSLLSDALPSVVIGDYDALKDFDWEKKMTVQTDMTQEEWNKYSANDFTLPQLTSLDMEDPTLSAMLKERIQGQINYDAGMWGITRGIKQWYNSWDSRDVVNWFKSLFG